MQESIILLTVIAVLAVPVMAIAALVLAVKAVRRNEELTRRVENLTREVRSLRARETEGDAAASADAPAAETPAVSAAVPQPSEPPPASAVPETPDTAPAGEDERRGFSLTFLEGETYHPGSSKAEPSQTVAFLRRLRLYPPSADERGEAGLGAWWATRLGILIAVIAAVFFGTYISRDTASWVRWIGLLAVACGTCGLGAWLERKSGDVAPFGRVVFAGGLALVYFCAFAAYAVEPVRIVTGAATGALLQTAAVAVILAASLWRRRETVAVLAILLGYVSCLFAFVGDLANFAMVGAALLAAGAGALLLWSGWRRPAAVALGGAWTVAAVLVIFLWIPNSVSVSFSFGMSTVAVAFGFFLVLEAAAARMERGFRGSSLAVYHFLNSAAAIALGWVFVWQVFPGNLHLFYLVFAVLMFATWAEFHLRRETQIMATAFFVKGSAFVALFFVAYFTGEVRWLAILAQAACLLVSLRTRPKFSVELVFYAAAGVAFVLFFRDVFAAGAPEDLSRVLSGLFVLAAAGVLAARRHFIAEDTADEDPSVLLAFAAQFAVGAAAMAFVYVFFGTLGLVLSGVALAAVFGALELAAAPNRRWFAAAGMVFLYAQAAFIFGWPAGAGTGSTVLAGAVLSLFGLAASAFVAARWKREDAWPAGVETGLHAIWLLALSLTLFRTAPDAGYFLLTVVGTWGVLGAAALLGLRRLVLLSCLPFFYGLLLAFWAWPAEVSVVALWTAAVLGAAYMAIVAGGFKTPAVLPGLSGGNPEARGCSGGLLAAAVFFLAVQETVFPEGTPFLVALGALGAGAAWRWRRLYSWGVLAAGIMALAHLDAYRRFLEITVQEHAPVPGAGGAFVLLAMLPAAATAGLALWMLAEKRRPDDTPNPGVWAAGGGALALIYVGAMLPVFGLATYATVLWGVSAVLLFVLGLVFQVMPFRLIALGGLGLCVLRLFAYDVQDTLYRIVAFAALGVVLLGVGYLYHRYRDWIEGTFERERGTKHGVAPPDAARPGTTQAELGFDFEEEKADRTAEKAPEIKPAEISSVPPADVGDAMKDTPERKASKREAPEPPKASDMPEGETAPKKRAKKKGRRRKRGK